ncbi:hypothetical protein Taro_008945 [Colocasia esculenta]|uniref:Uncharacterized protein n=1 Tax=Colocasia esculenta TaxID=4460 RepID=A0A843U3P8_COLES|nr:hypothetical protein [Colocasia esculenta]
MGMAWPASLAGILKAYPEMLLATACFILFRRLSRNRRLPVCWPVVGMLPYVVTHVHHLHDWTADVLRESRYSFRFLGPWFADKEVLLTCDPANVNHIFNVNFSNYPKGGDFADIFDVLGNGIFNADAESWRSQRRMAHALVSHARFRVFLARASRDKVRRSLVPLLRLAAERGEVLDLQEVFTRFSFDSSCTLIFGADPGSLSPDFPSSPFAHAIDVAEKVIFIRHVMPKTWWKALRWLKLGHERRFAEAWETIDRCVAKYISQRRELQRSGPTAQMTSAPKGVEGEEGEGLDMLTSYLQQQAGTGTSDVEFDRFLRDTALNLMIAGRDTTSAGLSWFFWLLSTNPEVEAKILEELRDQLPAEYHAGTGGDGLAVFDPVELSKMAYLHAALCEALRLYPPVPFEHKAPLKPEVLPSGAKVYERTRVVVSIYAMGRMEGIWGKDCKEFRPERWISETGKVKHEPSYKFLSFNAGPRTCLGKEIAFTQMKAAAAAIIYNFKVEVVRAHVVAPKLSIILHMENGLKVTVTRRHK